MTQEILVPGELSLAQLRRLCGPNPVPVALDPACRAAIRAGAVPLARRTGMGELWAVSLVSLIAFIVFVAGSFLRRSRIASRLHHF